MVKPPSRPVGVPFASEAIEVGLADQVPRRSGNDRGRHGTGGVANGMSMWRGDGCEEGPVFRLVEGGCPQACDGKRVFPRLPARAPGGAAARAVVVRAPDWEHAEALPRIPQGRLDARAFCRGHVAGLFTSPLWKGPTAVWRLPVGVAAMQQQAEWLQWLTVVVARQATGE